MTTKMRTTQRKEPRIMSDTIDVRGLSESEIMAIDNLIETLKIERGIETFLGWKRNKKGRKVKHKMEVSVWEDSTLKGPFPLTRRQIYEDL